jgi:hypothetical protein
VDDIAGVIAKDDPTRATSFALELQSAVTKLQKLGCCRFQRHFVKELNKTEGCFWRREGNSPGDSSSRR